MEPLGTYTTMLLSTTTKLYRIINIKPTNYVKITKIQSVYLSGKFGLFNLEQV